MAVAVPDTIGFAIAATLVLLAGLFAFRQWADRSQRDPEQSADDRAHFSRQDVRRFAGSVLMVVIALAMSFGLWINPRASRSHARLWGEVWLVVFMLVCVLAVVAALDWWSIRAYALRHRRALMQERLEAIEAERRLRARSPEPRITNGDGSHS